MRRLKRKSHAKCLQLNSHRGESTNHCTIISVTIPHDILQVVLLVDFNVTPRGVSLGKLSYFSVLWSPGLETEESDYEDR